MTKHVYFLPCDIHKILCDAIVMSLKCHINIKHYILFSLNLSVVSTNDRLVTYFSEKVKVNIDDYRNVNMMRLMN